jgi:hypothetical protein
MTTTLAVHHTSDHDDAIAAELAGQPADLVTILLVPDGPVDLADLELRLAELITRAELATGAPAVGIIGSEDDIASEPFDAVARTPILAAA